MTKWLISFASSVILVAIDGCGGGSEGGLTACSTPAQCDVSEMCLDGFCVFVPETPPPGEDGGLDAGPFVMMDGGLDGNVQMDVGVADVGPPDAGPPDAGPPDAGQPRCMTPDCNLCADLHPTAEICENFDDAVTAPWTPSLGAGGSLGLTDTEFLAGGRALRASAPVGSGGRYQWALDTPITSGDIYVRAYVFVPNATTLNDFAVLVNLDNGSNDKVSLDLGAGGGVKLIRTEGLRLSSRPGTVPPNSWRCLEFHYRVSEPGEPGATSLFVEGQVVSELDVADATAPSGGFTRVGVGIVSSGPANPAMIEVLVDEFVLSTDARIGCVP